MGCEGKFAKASVSLAADQNSNLPENALFHFLNLNLIEECTSNLKKWLMIDFYFLLQGCDSSYQRNH